MALGDGTNDLSMIQAAGLGVAMSNAHQLVLAAADHVTTSNDEDGVAKAIRDFVL
jgi:hydroxymethylpyrimidine pyrophosphatase-like HAD family hydrolase